MTYFTREARVSFEKDLQEENKQEKKEHASVGPVLKELTVKDIAMGCRDMLLNRQDVPRRRKGVNRQTFKQQEYEFEQKRKDWEDFWKNKDQKYKNDNKEYTKEDVFTSLKIWKHSQKLKIRAKKIIGGLTAPTISVATEASTPHEKVEETLLHSSSKSFRPTGRTQRPRLNSTLKF